MKTNPLKDNLSGQIDLKFFKSVKLENVALPFYSIIKHIKVILVEFQTRLLGLHTQRNRRRRTNKKHFE